MMGKTSRLCDTALRVLQSTNNDAVMYGDLYLLQTIAVQHGWPLNGDRTCERVLNALSKTPGKLIPGKTLAGNNKLVRIFRLTEL